MSGPSAIEVLRGILADDHHDAFLRAGERASLAEAIRVMEAAAQPSPPVAPMRESRTRGRFIRFFVEGLPTPQGSKTMGHTKDGRAFMRESNAQALARWRKAVKEEALLHRVSWVRQTPVVVEMKFIMPMRKGEWAADWCTVAPDIDKLTRGVLDALTKGKALVDDAQVVMTLAAKVRGSNVGMWCHVREAYGVDYELRYMEAQFHKEEPQCQPQ